jgi:hypothetical protein
VTRDTAHEGYKPRKNREQDQTGPKGKRAKRRGGREETGARVDFHHNKSSILVEDLEIVTKQIQYAIPSSMVVSQLSSEAYLARLL